MINSNSNIVSLLHQRAVEHCDQIAYVFLKDGKTIASNLTYGELDRKARAIAAALQSQENPGDRALLLYSSSEEFLPAFFGCLYARIVAVPTPAIDAVRLKRVLPRLQAIAKDSQATLILTTSRLASQLEEVYTQITQLRSAQLLVTDAIDTEDLPEFARITNSKDLAYLQYTSGSTSKPKGVMISHENLIDNLACITEAHGHNENSTCLTWTPYFHDYGLVSGLLQPLYAAVPCYILSPVSFIKKPIRWLEAISHYRVTHSGAPNFAYDYCVNQIQAKQLSEIDLSSWRVAHTGAETIRPDTLQKFAQTFQSCGFNQNAFYPSYGLAEATLMVTTRSQSDSPVFLTVAADDLTQNKAVEVSQAQKEIKTQVLTGCGCPTGDTKVVIVDPQTLTQCAADEVGEIWVSSKSVAQGYWNRSLVTQETFPANLPNFPDTSFLRTGDLGFLKDGQLFVTGRFKDLIIIKGKNYYPQDIEFTVEQSHPQLRANSSAVFSVDFNGLEELVVVAEIDSRSGKHLDRDTVFTAISNAIAQEHQLSLHSVALLKRGSIPKTSSGKIQRHACRQGFINRSLESIAVWNRETADVRAIAIPENEYEFRIQQIWQEVLSLDTMSIHDNFFEFGGDSLLAANVLTKVESRFGQTLPVSTLSAAPTIKQFAQCLQKPDWSLSQRSLVPIKPQGNKQPLFFVHPRSGSVMLFGNLARYLDLERPFYGLQAVGLNGEQEPYTRIEAMAAHYIREIQTVQPEGPYLLGGRCFGGTVAFEMAQQLTTQGYEVSSLILVESPLSKMIDRTLAQKIRQNMEKMREMSVFQASNFQQVMNANAQAYKHYCHQAYPGSLTYICAENHLHDPSYGFGWARIVAGELTVHQVPGDHMNIDEEPNVRFLADKLSDCLNESERHSIEESHDISSHDVAGVKYQPHVYELAKYICERTKIETIIDISSGSRTQLEQFTQDIKIIRINNGKDSAQISKNLFDREVELINLDLSSDKIAISDRVFKNSIVICADIIEHLPDPTLLIDILKQWSSICKYLLISTPAKDRIRGSLAFESPANKVAGMEWTLDELCSFFGSRNFPIGFYGYTINDEYHAWKTTSLIISGKEAVYLKQTKVLVTAIINCYNEADIIAEVISHLVKQNINIIVVDNWSTDGSYEIIQQLAKEHSRVKVTRFPNAPSRYFNWNEQLINTVKISEQHGHGWYIHYDADEIRESPWQDVSLQDAISFVDSLGYNAIDFTLLNFRYIKNDRDYSNLSPTKRLRYCEFGDRPGHFRQTKAWKYYGQKVNLNKSGGHQVKFNDQKIYPFKFLIRHYPLRSPEQSFQKLYQDRLPRFSVEQKKFGWHKHYDNLPVEQLKGWDKKHLMPWCFTTFSTDYLIERLSCIGLPKPKPPKSKKAFIKTICVLGMHRSGTSCLAGSLQAAGIPGGNVIDYDRDNLKGNRENPLFMRLNDLILNYNQGTWDKPPQTLEYNANHEEQRDRLLEQLNHQYPVWMFKDPRTVLTLPFWQSGLNNLQLIGTFRHPFKVAMSLYQRPEISVSLREGLKLWIHYNSLILKTFNQTPFPLICFDLPQEEYLARLNEIIACLNTKVGDCLELSQAKVREFYESGLIHQQNTEILSVRAEDTELLAQAESLYQELKAKAGLNTDLDKPQDRVLSVPLVTDSAAYLQVIEAQPNNSQLYFMLARAQHDEGDLAGALASSKKALELDKHNFDVVEQLSKFLVEAKQNSEAIAIVKSMLESQPDSVRIHLLLAQLQRQQGDLESEIITYQKLVELLPNRVDFQLHLGNILLKCDRAVEAVSSLTKAIKFHPTNPNLHFVLGRAYLKQQEIEQAIASFQNAIQLNPDCPSPIYTHLGKAFEQQKDMKQTLKMHQKAIELQADSASAHTALGNYYRQTKDWKNATLSYQQAIKINPNDGGLQYTLARVLQQQDKFKEAIIAYQKAIQLQPKNFNLYTALGSCYRQQKNWEKAIEYFQQSIELKSNNPGAYFGLGQVLREEGKVKEAIIAYKNTVKFNPHNFDAYIWLGSCYCQQKNWEQAITSYQIAIKLNPNNPGVYFALGQALQEHREFKQAIPCYERAISLNHPNLFGIYKTIGDVLIATNEIKQAISAYEQAMAIKPNNSEIKKTLQELNARLF